MIPLCSPCISFLLAATAHPEGNELSPLGCVFAGLCVSGALELCPKCSSLRLHFLNLLLVTTDTVGRG